MAENTVLVPVDLATQAMQLALHLNRRTAGQAENYEGEFEALKEVADLIGVALPKGSVEISKTQLRKIKTTLRYSAGFSSLAPEQQAALNEFLRL